MKSKILILLLSICCASLVLSVVDPSFITVYVHKDMQAVNANSELQNVSEKLKDISIYDKTEIAVGSQTYKIKEITVTARFGRQDNDNVVIGNSFPAEEKKLTTTYNIKDNVINLEFIIKLDEKEGTFTTTFSNKATNVVINFGKDQEDYKMEISKISLQFTQSNGDCKVAGTKISDQECTEFFTKFIERSIAKINENSQSALEEKVNKNLPTSKTLSEKVISREDSSVSIVFNIKPTTNPKLITNATDGEAILYRLNGNVALGGATTPTFDALTSATPEFENFIISNGKYQYAIKQEIIDKSYSLVKPKKEVEFTSQTTNSLYTLTRVFPEITRNYPRTSTFKLFQKTTGFSYSSARPVFNGVLKIEFPKIQDNNPVVVEITYEFIPDIIALSAYKTNNEDFLNLDVITPNSYIRYLQVSNTSGITDEFELRKWLTPVLIGIYEQKENKSPFADDTKVEIFFPNYKNLETYYNGAYVFSMKDTTTIVETKAVKELLFLGQ